MSSWDVRAALPAAALLAYALVGERDWPGWEWLIVGTAGNEPVVRSFRIEGGVVTEVDV